MRYPNGVGSASDGGETSAVRLTATATGVRLELHAKPRAKKSRVVGAHGEALSVAIAAPPVDGAANDEVVRFVAELCGVPKGKVTLVRAARGRAGTGVVPCRLVPTVPSKT